MDLHRGTDRPLTPDTALELRDVHVRFGDVRALDGASFRARTGAVHALLGENGAGKTTLMRVAYGMIRPEAGVIRLAGAASGPASPAAAIRAGIGMVHQHFTLVPAMTVAENVALGGLPLDDSDGNANFRQARAWIYDARRTADRVREIGERTGLRLDPHARVAGLGVGAQQRLEIVKALARSARILILDEPTAVLSPPESEDLLRRLRAMADEGRTIVLITHKLREALGIADEVTVLRRGRTVLHGPAGDVSAGHLARAMIGADAAEPVVREVIGTTSAELEHGDVPDAARRATARQRAPGAEEPHAVAHPVIAAREIAVADERGVIRIADATLHVSPGEIVGIAAVEGSGHRELIRALAGRLRPERGSLVLPSAVGFIPEDRQHEALALDLSLSENVALRGAGTLRGIVRWREVATRTRALIGSFDVRAQSERAPARALSGGNQQKLVLARELEGRPAALVAENPTRGLDVHATAAIHARLREARRAGMAIVLHSSDVDDTLDLADRMLVVFGGAVREVSRDRQVVGAAMVGLE